MSLTFSFRPVRDSKMKFKLYVHKICILFKGKNSTVALLSNEKKFKDIILKVQYTSR